ncbi:MAG: cupin domain-containing protein [Planctomycetes bacterium]|nr:cupin domain-containing protein [Planctomycetota bacterium]
MPHVPVSFDLNTSDWKQTKYPGVSIRFLRTDKRTGDATALIRMDAGCGYPQHRHVGEEEVLVLAGAYKDHAGTYRTGEYHVNKPGSVHQPVATGDGTCILFAVAHGGIELIEAHSPAGPRHEPRFEVLIDRWADNPRVHEWHKWWTRRTEELRPKFPWLWNQKKLAHVASRDLVNFLDDETNRLTMRWPLGLFGTHRRKVASTPHLAECLDKLLWADEPLEARVDGAMFGEYAFRGGGKSVTLASLLLQTVFPEKVVGLLSLRFALQAFPMPMPPGATPGEKFALMSRTVQAAWKSARPDQPLNLAHWVLWMEYASHHSVRPAIFRA